MRVGIAAAAGLLESGAVVAYPTETVYGLGCDIQSETAIARLHELKGRSADRGMSILVPSASVLSQLGLDERAVGLARRFWPGPLTLVLEGARDRFPLVATEFGVAFRCSSHPEAAELAQVSKVRVASTSANRSGEAPAVTASEVEDIFGAEFPVAGGAPAGGGLPSTVVALRSAQSPICLREGAIPFEVIETALAELRASAERIP